MLVYSMIEEERKKYLEAYYNNEADANRKMSFANAFAALLMLAIWICYLAGFFQVHKAVAPVIHVAFPISISILLTPLICVLRFKKMLSKPRYKFFVVFSFVFVIAAINIIIPKHTLLGWALCIIMTAHFYNPKLCKMTFGVVIGLMLLCMYASMFLGEYDPNLIGNGVIIDGEIVYVDGAKERYNMLHQMLLEGENRYLKVFLYYYIPRSGILTLIFLVCNSLNVRTYKLLVSEIKVNSEQEKTRTELEVAKEIQLATLPKDFVTTEFVEIVGELKAAKEVGGDFYDYIKIDDQHTALIIGDVSGKGVPAAMFMMKTITSFRDFAVPNKKPSDILKEVNASIFKGNKASMFVTCFLAILDKRNGKVIYANAGHNPPILGSNHNYKYLNCNSGFLLGCFKDCFLKDEEITLNPGESLTLYTDGITEARNSNGDFFGEEKLLKVFNKKDYTCTVELHHTIKDEIASFVKDAPQSDDITFVTIKYQGDNYSFEEKSYNAVEDSVPEMLNFISGFCEKHDISESFKSQLLVVGDELLSNIINHGYENKGGGIFVRLLFNDDKKEFVFTIIDQAKAFNQLSVDNPTYANGKPLEVGGLGLTIVKNIMDEYAYDRINNKNILVLKKRF